MKSSTRILGTVALATFTAGSVFAQAAYPSKPITIISAFAPGGASDVIARLLASRLQRRLGQTVIVDNKAGASGNIATEFVSRAKPDGYTLLMHNNTLTINTALGMRQAFNLQKDLKFIVAVASTPIAIAVHTSLPVKTVDELAAYARQQNGKLSFSSCGNGTAQHFTGARFAQVAKAEMIHVAYKGCAPAVVDGAGGTVPVLFSTAQNVDAQVQGGRLRYIAVGAQHRLPFKPDLPTISESKAFAGFEAEVWFGLIGPAGLPAAVAKRIETEVMAVMADKQVQEDFADRLISVRLLNSVEFDKQITQDLVNWKQLSEELKVKLE